MRNNPEHDVYASTHIISWICRDITSPHLRLAMCSIWKFVNGDTVSFQIHRLKSDVCKNLGFVVRTVEICTILKVCVDKAIIITFNVINRSISGRLSYRKACVKWSGL